MDLLWLTRRLVALALLVWVVTTSRRAARLAGGTPWKWSSLGVLVFYLAFVVVTILIFGLFAWTQFTPGKGMGDSRRLIPVVMGGAMLAGFISGQAALRATLRWLAARSTSSTRLEGSV